VELTVPIYLPADSTPLPHCCPPARCRAEFFRNARITRHSEKAWILVSRAGSRVVFPDSAASGRAGSIREFNSTNALCG
jgi:hypothetical protein